MKATCLLGLSLWGSFVMAGQTAQELIDAAIEAREGKNATEALELLNKAIAKDGKNVKAYFLRAKVHEDVNRFKEAVADYTKVIDLDDQQKDIYHHRGCVHFKLGQVKESVADFDKYLEFNTGEKVSHWQRGISCYYAGLFDEGRKQFEAYQTFKDNDVENAVWRYMCMARLGGIAKARKAMLKIKEDTRVPMKEVYEMFSGRLTPEEVMDQAKAGKPTPKQLNGNLFYANLYVGIHYEIEGDKKKALEHLQAATEDHRIGHYMWDVARIHRDLLKRELEKK